MKNSIVMTSIVLECLLLANSAGATPNKPLAKYFYTRLSQVESVVQNEEVQTSGGSTSVLLQDINVDLFAQVSFGLSDVFKLTLATELDFVLVPDRIVGK
jgi:hypothetical protein